MMCDTHRAACLPVRGVGASRFVPPSCPRTGWSHACSEGMLTNRPASTSPLIHTPLTGQVTGCRSSPRESPLVRQDTPHGSAPWMRSLHSPRPSTALLWLRFPRIRHPSADRSGCAPAGTARSPPCHTGPRCRRADNSRLRRAGVAIRKQDRIRIRSKRT